LPRGGWRGSTAKKFGDGFGSGDWAYLAGLWHDLGKKNMTEKVYNSFAEGKQSKGE